MDESGLAAEFEIKNIVYVVGKAVPIIFLTFPKNIGDYPEYIFKGCEKIIIQPGNTETVKIVADDHALSYFNVKQNK